MKHLLLFLSVTWCVNAIVPETYSLEEADRHFETFTQLFNKQYANDEEREARFQIFKRNLLEANQLNENSDNAVFGITKFMDLTTEEFLNQYTGVPINETYGSKNCDVFTDANVRRRWAPDSLDFRNYGYVTPVKNQGRCGSCYAFSSIGNIEGQCAKKFGVKRQLSEQQIIDCAAMTNGCIGGWMSNAFRSLIDLGGSVSQADYPYLAKKNQCQHPLSSATLSGCRKYNLKSQEKLKQVLYQNGPLSIAMEPARLKLFKGETLTDTMCYQPNQKALHAVVLVGYGTDHKGVPYWLVKNSWGADWGDKGYFRFQRGEGAFSCGMMKYERCTSLVSSCV